MPYRFTRSLVVVFCLVAGATGHPEAQATPPAQGQVTFRASADYVQVSVQARDRDGRPVTDLTAGDVQLFEDNQLQDIATFTRIDVPLHRRLVVPAARTAPPLGETTRTTNVTTEEGRTFVVFVDAMHIAPERTVPMRRLLKQFIVEHMGDNDRAAIVVTGGLTPSQDFTADKHTLLAAIDRVTGDRLQSRMLSKWQQKLRQPYNYTKDLLAGERAHRAQQSLFSLRRVVQMLAGLSGRRTAVLYVSEGFDIDMNDRIGKAGTPHAPNLAAGRDADNEAWNNDTMEAHYASQVADELQITAEASTRANVAIYTIDPRGLADAEEHNIHVGGPGEGSSFLPTSLLRAESFRMQQNLRDIAGRTGGRAIVGTNNFAGPLAAIVEDASHYYILTYRTTHRDTGRFHRIKVRTSRAGITLTARDGYYSPRADAQRQADRSPLAGLLESPLQLPGLTMSAASTVIPSADGGTLRFVVEFGGGGLGSAPGAPPVIDLAYLLTDDEGRILRQVEKTLTLAVSTDMHTSLTTQGLRYEASLTAPPGRHQMRLAAINRATQEMGSLFWDVEVSSLPPSDVVVSPLVLTSRVADTMPTISDVSQGPAPDSGLMTARRAFGADDVLSVSTLVANGRRATDPLTVAFVISTDEGREVARKDVALPTADRASEAAAYTQHLALDPLPPGHYRADFLVRSANGRVRAHRAILFEITRRPSIAP